MKFDGTSDYKVDKINWRRPGVIELSVSRKIGQKDAIPAPPKKVPLDSTGEDIAFFLIERRVEGSAYKTVTCTYVAGKLLPSFGQDDDGTAWSMDVSLMQVPITCHPNLKAIMAAGGGVLKNGEVDWPRYVNNKKNTWYGTTSFLVPSIVVTKDEVDEKSSTGSLSFPHVDDVGYSVANIPGGFGGDSAAAGRKAWVLESHSLRKIGKQRRETKVWRHGGVLGWVNQMYQKGFFP